MPKVEQRPENDPRFTTPWNGVSDMVDNFKRFIEAYKITEDSFEPEEEET